MCMNRLQKRNQRMITLMCDDSYKIHYNKCMSHNDIPHRSGKPHIFNFDIVECCIVIKFILYPISSFPTYMGLGFLQYSSSDSRIYASLNAPRNILATRINLTKRISINLKSKHLACGDTVFDFVNIRFM